MVALIGTVFYPIALHAAAPQLNGQAPGYYQMILGDIEIVALSDGTAPFDMRNLLTNTTPMRVEQLLKSSGRFWPIRWRRRSTRISSTPEASWRGSTHRRADRGASSGDRKPRFS